MRIFEPILGEKANSLRESILPLALSAYANFVVSGGHTRAIQIATPTVGGLMKFAVKTVTCMGCKTPLRTNNSVTSEPVPRFSWELHSQPSDADGAVCNSCRPRLGELYQKQVTHSSELQVRFSRLWTQCQRCQGSLHQVCLFLRGHIWRLKLPLGRYLHKQGLSDILYAQESPERCPGCQFYSGKI